MDILAMLMLDSKNYLIKIWGRLYVLAKLEWEKG